MNYSETLSYTYRHLLVIVYISAHKRRVLNAFSGGCDCFKSSIIRLWISNESVNEEKMHFNQHMDTRKYWIFIQILYFESIFFLRQKPAILVKYMVSFWVHCIGSSDFPWSLVTFIIFLWFLIYRFIKNMWPSNSCHGKCNMEGILYFVYIISFESYNSIMTLTGNISI